MWNNQKLYFQSPLKQVLQALGPLGRRCLACHHQVMSRKASLLSSLLQWGWTLLRGGTPAPTGGQVMASKGREKIKMERQKERQTLVRICRICMVQVAITHHLRPAV